MDSQQGVSETAFLLLAYESIKYILSKNIEQKEQKNQIEELGFHLGEKAANYFMTTSSIDPPTNDIQKELDNVMKFLLKEVWTFIFGSSIPKLQRNTKATFLIEAAEIKMHLFLLTEKGNAKDEKADVILWFIYGLIKGVLSTFNYECTVSCDIKHGSSSKSSPNAQFVYPITVQILNVKLP